MPDFYMVYLGGGVEGANIEVHDVQFVAADALEDAFGRLRDAWFGDKSRCHIDSYRKIVWIDGWDIALRRDAPDGDHHLWFVNMGGYVPGQFAEHHQFALFVARDANDAKRQARETLLTGYFKQHRDNLLEVDDCVRLPTLNGWHVHLRRNPNGSDDGAIWQGYLPI